MFRMRSSLPLLSIPLSALASVLPQLPSNDTPVAEVSACHPLGQSRTDLRELAFRLEFVGTASNNVEVAFGCDLDGNGELESHETRIVVGWECGRYFVENFRTGLRTEAVGATNTIRRTLAWGYSFRDDARTLRSFSVEAESRAVFPGLAANPPDWIYDREWDLMRLVARGTDVQDECFSVKTTGIGTIISVR